MNVRENTKRNLIVGLINKIILLIMPFVVRTVINVSLGAEYLGLSSLFSSIIQVLSLTELGFSSALVYHMYRPVAEKNYREINALLNLYKKAYMIIGGVIVVCGILIVPFLQKLINGEYPSNINIYILFLIYVANTSISYFMCGYKQSLLAAYQREDINSFINLVVQLGLQVTQIILLISFRNYYFYVICLPVFTMINNIWIGIITKKIFPFAKPEGNLDKNTIKGIKKLVAGTFIQKACAITRNSLDSICISAFLGLTLTAVYNNYYLIFNGLTVLLAIVSTSLAGGIGNHVAVKTVKQNFEELKQLDFLYMTVSGWFTICLFCLYQPFMEIWMGENMMLPFKAVILLCSYFYLLKMGDMRFLYSSANGLWWKMRWRSVAETVLNLILNVSLGKLFGICGIIVATMISLFVCNYFWSSYIVFSEYFKEGMIIKYFVYHAKYAIVTIIICVITFLVTNALNPSNLKVVNLMVKGVVCVLLSTGLYWLSYGKTSIFKESVALIKGN